jgi:hypothetical protein
MKECKKCLAVKELNCFKFHPETKDKRTNKCKVCINEEQRISRVGNNNVHTFNYEKTHKGFLVRLYRNMKSRIKGVQKHNYKLYEGRELLNKDDFYKWSLNNKDFFVLFENYKASGYNRKLAPSVDRINSKIGYTIDNMEFVTLSENCRRSSVTRLENKQHKVN